ncbi:hypothetical protein D3C78_613560 [compost metagenome]
MRNPPRHWLLSALTVAVALSSSVQANQPASTAGPEFAFEASNYPTRETSQRLYDELDYQRAVQAYIWGQPLVGLAAMAEGARRIGVQPMELFVFDKGLQVNQALQTGNDDVIYSFSYYNLKDSGPLVVEVAPGNQYGALLDAWQRAIEDLGRIGPDKGEGGKYLIVPPGYQGELPKSGYIIRQSQTNTGMVFLRAVRGPGESRESAVARLKQGNIYPYAEHAKPPQFRLRMMGTTAYDGLTPRGLDYFELLARRIREGDANERDRMMLGMLDSLGIHPDKPFAPDERLKQILERAAQTGRAMVANLEINPRHVRRVMFKDSHWRSPTGLTHYSQELGPLTQIDERAALARFGFGMHKFLDPKFVPVPGKGAVYGTSYQDAKGEYLVGSNTYRLHVPANAPVLDYWSVTAYDAENFHFVDTEQKRPALSSLQDLKRNADGSVDVYFSPNEPEGMASNWIRTEQGKGFLLLFRLFSPTRELYEGKWQLGDLTKVEAPGQS